MEAGINIPNASLCLGNNAVCAPLIQRFLPQNILQSLTIRPMNEVRFPVRISAKYKLIVS